MILIFNRLICIINIYSLAYAKNSRLVRVFELHIIQCACAAYAMVGIKPEIRSKNYVVCGLPAAQRLWSPCRVVVVFVAYANYITNAISSSTDSIDK